jgi:hypothetical protein
MLFDVEVSIWAEPFWANFSADESSDNTEDVYEQVDRQVNGGEGLTILVSGLGVPERFLGVDCFDFDDGTTYVEQSGRGWRALSDERNADGTWDILISESGCMSFQIEAEVIEEAREYVLDLVPKHFELQNLDVLEVEIEFISPTRNQSATTIGEQAGGPSSAEAHVQANENQEKLPNSNPPTR